MLPTAMALMGGVGAVSVVGGFWYWATPSFWEVGYMPIQPGTGFNHQLHAGKLGMDCRYCHTKVEKSPEANIPNVATCYGCHQATHVSADVVPDAKVEFIRNAYAANESIAWRRVHKLPDYVRNFPHNAHVAAGVSCFSCHGQITAMPVVAQEHSLSMSWCLNCHRKTAADPSYSIVGPDKVTQLQWAEEHFKKVTRGEVPADGVDAAAIYNALKLSPPQNCGACHY